MRELLLALLPRLVDRLLALMGKGGDLSAITLADLLDANERRSIRRTQALAKARRRVRRKRR